MELASIEFPQANVGIVLQDERCSGSIVPSKVYSLLASGLPILFIGPRSATPARIIELFQCGWHVQTGHSGELIALLNRLASRPDEVQAASHRARQAFLENFDRPIGTARILTLLGIEEKQTSAVA
jgi:glycosyltransferase involved in cell wall biosynthesis